jgi:formylglycine-generating enzyme required for sulfatase activity
MPRDVEGAMREESGRTHDVFLSYSSKDKTWADAACAVLEQHRIRCWIAPRDMTPGDEWGAGIIKGLNASRIMVLIFSDHANASKHVRKEVERAISKELSVLAFRIQDVAPKDAMEFNLSNIHWLDAFTPPVEAQLELLAASVSKQLGKGFDQRSRSPASENEPQSQPLNMSRAVRRRLLIAVGFAALSVLIVAGLFAIFWGRTIWPSNETPLVRDKTVPPIAVTAPRPDREVQPSREWKNAIGMKFVRIDPGEFVMGTTRDQVFKLGRAFGGTASVPEEQPKHSVQITRPFSLGVHEVTQGQYFAVMEENPSNSLGDDLPVEKVSWTDAVDFCNKLSKRDGRKPYYHVQAAEVTIAGGNGYRLPTEGEWEYACRAGASTIYPFGDDNRALGDHAWHIGNSAGKTHPVGRKGSNAFGLYDMLGNVLEWCADAYDPKYYDSSPVNDPPGASGASRRAVRGGGWYSQPVYTRSAYRIGFAPGYVSAQLGFRVVAVQE